MSLSIKWNKRAINQLIKAIEYVEGFHNGL